VKSGTSKLPFDTYDDPRPRIFSNELKYKDTANTIVGSNTGSVVTITNPTQGVGATNRLGDRAKILRIENLGVYLALSPTYPQDFMRVILLQAKGLTSTPAVTDVLTVASPYAPYVYNARDVFDIIDDKLYKTVYTADSSCQVIKEAYVPPIKEMKFKSGTNTVYNGQLYMIFVAGSNALSAYNSNVRVWFEDSN